jgi:hypothetical protein
MSGWRRFSLRIRGISLVIAAQEAYKAAYELDD